MITMNTWNEDHLESCSIISKLKIDPRGFQPMTIPSVHSHKKKKKTMTIPQLNDNNWSKYG